jgi:hypothetical protein
MTVNLGDTFQKNAQFAIADYVTSESRITVRSDLSLEDNSNFQHSNLILN